MSMGSKLAEARRKNNLTQEQLAERLGVTRQAVSRWESDTAYPETDKIVRMSRLLGVSCDWLLQDGEEAPAPPAGRLRAWSPRCSGRQRARKVQRPFTGMRAYPPRWCVIREFDGAWANVELVKEKKEQRENRLIPLSSIRAITFVKGKEDV